MGPDGNMKGSMAFIPTDSFVSDTGMEGGRPRGSIGSQAHPAPNACRLAQAASTDCLSHYHPIMVRPDDTRSTNRFSRRRRWARGLALAGTRPQGGGGGGHPPPPLRTPKLSHGTVCFVGAGGAADFVLGIRRGVIFLFHPMCLYSKYSEFCGEFKNG